MAKETRQFQTESKQLLNLMINSIYSNKEVFLRELISNASDAIDKRRYESLNSNGKIEVIEHPEIWLISNKEERTLTIKDDGIGMSKDELINNIGTIAKSGSKEFIEKLKEAKDKQDIDIIGQFGVGFYSAFMVAKKIVIETKGLNSDEAYRFTSDGGESYEIEDISLDKVGTSITLYLKDDTEEEKYDSYLDYYTISYLVEKYSNYVRYPIKMAHTVSEPEKDENGKEIEGKTIEKEEISTLNSMIPLWKKNKKDLKEEELNEFYKNTFHDYQDPLFSLPIKVEGMFDYEALIFIPSHLRNEVYQRDAAGLSLYTKNVFIMDKCKDLLPHYLYFLEGVVDSADLDLNISREMLQENRNIQKIKNSIETKFINALKDLKEKDKEKFDKIWDLFGVNIKYGIYENYGSKNDLLKDVLVFKSLKHDNYIDIKTYIAEKKEDQKAIYFASGSSLQEIKLLPEIERFKKNDIDVLLFDKDVDEFAIRNLNKFDDLEFKSISEFDEKDVSEEEKARIESLAAENKRQLDVLKEALKDKVSDVKLSLKLVDSPVSLSSEAGLSLNMEKILSQLDTSGTGMYNTPKVLEINPDHEIFKKITSLSDEEVKEYGTILYNEALLANGLEVKDKEEFFKAINKLLMK